MSAPLGRAELKISAQMFAIGLERGLPAFKMRRPVPDARVVDVWLNHVTELVHVVVEAPGLTGPLKSGGRDLPAIDDTCIRVTPEISTNVGEMLALHLTRITDRPCQCEAHVEDSPDRWRYTCPACMAKQALELLPGEWRDAAVAVRRELGELGPEPDPGVYTDEVPGA
jgi:hypothetical protein